MTDIRLHTLKPARGARYRRKLLGRGKGSGKGKTSGRGSKGQRARSGGKRGLKLKGMKRMLLRIPKTRGFKSGIRHPETVTLAQLDRWFQKGARVDVKTLRGRNLIAKNAVGAKVVQTGAITKPLTIVDLLASPGAKAAVEKAGGSFASAKPAAKKPLAKKAPKK
jgi:large subunit ribosomal protein L15